MTETSDPEAVNRAVRTAFSPEKPNRPVFDKIVAYYDEYEQFRVLWYGYSNTRDS